MATTKWATIYGVAQTSGGVNPGRRPYINWRVTGQSVTNNTSTVEFKVGSQVTNGATWGTFSGTMKYNGVSRSISGSVPQNSANVFTTFTATIAHASDGKKSMTVSLTGGISGSSGWTGTSLSKSITLPTIPRATVPTTTPKSAPLGSEVTINLPRASSAFTHTVSYSFGSSSGTISSSATTSVKWTPSMSLATNIPSDTSGTATISVVTKNGSTTIGTRTVNLTLTVPTSVVPTYSGTPSVANSVASLATKLGAANRYLQNVSKLKITTGNGAGIHGSTIDRYGIKVGSAAEKLYTSNTNIIEDLTASGSVGVSVRVRDTRGRWSSSKTVTITSTPYSPPKVTIGRSFRSTLSGTETSLGNYISLIHSGSVSSVKYGSDEKNSATMTIRYRIDGSTGSFTTSALPNRNPGSWNSVRNTHPSAVTIDNAYQVQITIADNFTSTKTVQVTVPVAATALSLSKTGAAVGKVAEAGGATLQVGGSLAFDVLSIPTNTSASRTPSDYYDDGLGVNYQRATENGLLTPIRSGNHYGVLVTNTPVISGSHTSTSQVFYCGKCTNIWTRTAASPTDPTWGPWSAVNLEDPNKIVINGVAYTKTGYLYSIPETPAFTQYDKVYARTVYLPLPYTPPEGWYFKPWTYNTSGHTIVELSSPIMDTGIRVRIIQIGSNNLTALNSIGWKLVRSTTG